MVEHSSEKARSVGAVSDRMQLVRVPDEVKVVTRHQEHVRRHTLEMQELLVPGHGVLQELIAAIVRQRHLYAQDG